MRAGALRRRVPGNQANRLERSRANSIPAASSSASAALPGLIGNAGLQRLLRTGDPRATEHASHGVSGDLARQLGAGRPLDVHARAFFEPRFGQDFGRVRVFTDANADRAARATDAFAFTVGNDIVFRDGLYAPQTPAGRHLLAHELTHTLQQRSAAAPMLQRYGPTAGCTATQQTAIHTAVDTATGWLDEAIRLLGESPLAATARVVLRRNFGPTDGVEANAPAIRARLETVRTLLGTIPLSCASGPADAVCAGGHCGWTSAAGAGAATICSDNTLSADTNPHFTAGCVLHETVHASDASMIATHDFYSGWRGISGSTADYPGTAPLQNADAYTTLVMDLAISSRLTLPLRLGLSGGPAFFPGALPGADPTWYARLYVGTEFQHPVLGLFNPTLGVGVSVIGESETAGAAPIASPTSALVSLLPGVRFGGQSGGLSVSLFGGPALAINEREADIGAEAGAGLGYRWRWLDVSLGAGYGYDPTREAGMEHVLTLGANVTFIPFEFAP